MAIAAAILVLATAAAGAAQYTFEPTPRSDLYDLDHHWAYLWGMEVSIPEGHTISSAWITMDDIRDWTQESNDLYITLVDDAPVGVTAYRDNQNPVDYFSGWGTQLHHYEDLPATAQDLTYHLDAAELAQLESDVADGIAALAFDPDCHFYNNGITFTITTGFEPGGDNPPPIPEPLAGTTLLAGLVVLARRRRRT
jgi:MYXO-CTERM domain-containing protein